MPNLKNFINMSDTYKTKKLGKRKRHGFKDFKTEAMMNRKCGSIDDKVDKMIAMQKAMTDDLYKNN